MSLHPLNVTDVRGSGLPSSSASRKEADNSDRRESGTTINHKIEAVHSTMELTKDMHLSSFRFNLEVTSQKEPGVTPWRLIKNPQETHSSTAWTAGLKHHHTWNWVYPSS